MKAEAEFLIGGGYRYSGVVEVSTRIAIGLEFRGYLIIRYSATKGTRVAEGYGLRLKMLAIPLSLCDHIP